MRTILAIAGCVAFAATADVAEAQHTSGGSGHGSAGATHAPYAGQQSRAIPSLSEQEIADLKAGRGMGLALPAELNGYPGPMHVLELAEHLKLDDKRKSEVQVVFDWMKAQAETLGTKLIDAEAAIGIAFRDGQITKQSLSDRVTVAEKIRAELRQVHLAAHIETAVLLTSEQKATYSALRGYIRTSAPSSTASGPGAEAGKAMQCGKGAMGSSGCCCSGGASAGGMCGGNMSMPEHRH